VAAVLPVVARTLQDHATASAFKKRACHVGQILIECHLSACGFDMALIPLTGDRWSGLPLSLCANAAASRELDLEIATPLLVLWNADGPTIEVRQTATRRWTVARRANHFSLFAAGSYDAIVAPAAQHPALVVGIPSEWRRALTPAGAHGAPPVQSRFGYHDRHLLRLVRALEAHRADGEPLGGLYTQSLSIVILDRLHTGAHDSAAGARALPALARRVIERLIDDRLDAPPELAKMAALAGMGTGQFVRSFKQAFGATPYQYVLQRRIDRAKSMLGSGRSLTSIGLELGFASHAHFTSAFHTRTGSTPSDYRRERRSPGTGKKGAIDLL
jgi:AraC family transcriptional regulator